VVQRARPLLRIGLELRIDEEPENALAFGALVDIEPRTALGAEFRYVRAVTPGFAVSGGGIAGLLHGTVLGPCAGAEVRIPMGKKLFLTVGPDVSVFAFGGDL